MGATPSRGWVECSTGLAAALVIACSDAESPAPNTSGGGGLGSGASDNGGQGAGASSTNGGAGGGSAGGQGGDGGVSPFETETVILGKAATVQVAAFEYQGLSGLSVFGAFVDYGGQELTTELLSSGVCRYAVAGRFDVRGSVESAGTMTITGGNAPYALDPNGDNLYFELVSGSSGPLLFDPGQTIAIGFAGDVVPPLTQDIVVPEALGGISPPFVQGMTIDGDADWTVSWNPLPTGTAVELTIRQRQDSGIFCAIDGAAGSVTVAAILLEQMDIGTVTVSLAAMPTLVTTVAEWDIRWTVASGTTGGAAEASLE
jgi:hypothetical protein